MFIICNSDLEKTVHVEVVIQMVLCRNKAKMEQKTAIFDLDFLKLLSKRLKDIWLKLPVLFGVLTLKNQYFNL